MPFLCNRLDKEYLERRREVPFLTERPSHYVKQIYVATQPIEEPERLRDIVTLMELYDGEDTTVSRLRLAAPRLRPPDEGRPGAAVGRGAGRKVFGENALALFGIDPRGGGDGRRNGR